MCDNQGIVLAWQGQHSRDSHIMNLMCTLLMFAAQHHSHYHNATSPRQNSCYQMPSPASNSPNSFLWLYRHSDSPARPLECSTPSNTTPATLASPLPCPVHKTVIPHRDQALSFVSAGHHMSTCYQLLAAQPPTLPLHCISKEWPQ